MYDLVVFDASGAEHSIGNVKIGQFGMAESQSRPNIEQTFDEIGAAFFSVGQDDSYYVQLNDLGHQLREHVLASLNDLAVHPELFVRALEEDVTTESLLRSVTASTVSGQFRRLARGGERLTRYSVRYQFPATTYRPGATQTLPFDVFPESEPPSNIHVLIGRNGVGKIFLLNNMFRALAEAEPDPVHFGSVESHYLFEESGPQSTIANLVSVGFSAFDAFNPVAAGNLPNSKVRHAYIGLKQQDQETSSIRNAPKSLESLADEFVASLRVCRVGARASRLATCLDLLNTDPVFREWQIGEAVFSQQSEVADATARDVFLALSSGHKIVVLTITRLVELVEESTLVLFDEPETHLHPPLLSAFIRALSELLTNRNGIAILATHSPVVLQEVPRSCVWKIRRSGQTTVAERPEVETFGENVGVLTHEVFGLQVTDTAYHRLITQRVDTSGNYEQAIEELHGQVGGEARGIIRALIEEREAESRS
jgi:AAA domain, putative AbiEii toxin, Type IV TA system